MKIAEVLRIITVAGIVCMLLIVGCAKQTGVVDEVAVEDAAIQEVVADTSAETKGDAKSAVTFSADITETVGSDKSEGKLYMKGKKMRREIAEGDVKQIVIVDMDKGITWLLDTDSKSYMEIKGIGEMIPTDEQAEEIMKEFGERKHVGKETINGHTCDKCQAPAHLYHPIVGMTVPLFLSMVVCKS